METTSPGLFATPSAPAPAAFRWQKLPVWLTCCATLGLFVAWSAVVARGYAAPLLLFPLVVGTILGGAVALLMRVLQIGHRPTAWLGAFLAVILAVVGQHYLTFWKVQRRFAQDPDRLGKLQLVAPERVPPHDFRDFMTWSAARGLPIGGYTARGGFAWLAWAVDGLLVFVPALLLVGATAPRPLVAAFQDTNPQSPIPNP